MPDRWLAVLGPLVAREARSNPSKAMDELLAAVVDRASARGLRSVVVEIERVAATAGETSTDPG